MRCIPLRTIQEEMGFRAGKKIRTMGHKNREGFCWKRRARMADNLLHAIGWRPQRNERQTRWSQDGCGSESERISQRGSVAGFISRPEFGAFGGRIRENYQLYTHHCRHTRPFPLPEVRKRHSFMLAHEAMSLLKTPDGWENQGKLSASSIVRYQRHRDDRK